MRWDFDLSRNSSLRTLETTEISINFAGDVASGFLKTVLSTITSPLPLDLIVNYGRCEVWSYRPSLIRARSVSPSERSAEALVHQERFKMFSEMYMVREFRLVLCADVGNGAAVDVMRALESIVEAERVNGRLDSLPCEPLIISEMRSRRTGRFCTQVGASANRAILISAL